MKTVMLDTNVVLEILRHEKGALEKLADFKSYTLAISYLVYVEVMAGAQLRQKTQTAKFLKKFAVKPFTPKAQEAGERLARNHFVGRENKPMDLLIAAHAKAENLAVVTKNAKDFLFASVKVYNYNTGAWIKP